MLGLPEATEAFDKTMRLCLLLVLEEQIFIKSRLIRNREIQECIRRTNSKNRKMIMYLIRDDSDL